MVQAATCALLPPLFFLQFLFYTDMVSVVFVMSTHLVSRPALGHWAQQPAPACTLAAGVPAVRWPVCVQLGARVGPLLQAVLHRRYVLAAVGAAAAVSVRQNNAVWADFSLGVTVSFLGPVGSDTFNTGQLAY
jgi:DIE2/ALG10 family